MMADIQSRGIAAYRQTMNPQPDDPEQKTTGQRSTDKQAKEGAAPKGEPSPAFIRSVEGSSMRGTPPADTRVRRVAKFLILIGSSQAARILAELDRQQVEEISREIATIRGIGGEEAESILDEFKSLLTVSAYSGASSGGIETARRILYAAYGPEKGEALLNKSVPGSKENIFGFLEEFKAEQLVFLLKDESPAASALVLARLPAKVCAETLAKFSPALKPEILRRIARQGEVVPEVLERVAGAIREKARYLGSSGSQDIAIDGMQTLAAILKQGDYSFGDRIVSELEMESPDIGSDLKNRLYTLDDVLGAYDRPLAEKLKTMPDRDIAVLLKGRSNEFREKILSNVSTVRRSMIREEGEILGAIPKRECDEAAGVFLAWFRMARENGELMVAGDEDWII